MRREKVKTLSLDEYLWRVLSKGGRGMELEGNMGLRELICFQVGDRVRETSPERLVAQGLVVGTPAGQASLQLAGEGEAASAPWGAPGGEGGAWGWGNYLMISSISSVKLEAR